VRARNATRGGVAMCAGIPTRAGIEMLEGGPKLVAREPRAV